MGAQPPEEASATYLESLLFLISHLILLLTLFLRVQLDEVLDPIGGDIPAFFGVHFFQEALADKRRAPGACDKKNNFEFLAILLSYF